MEVTMYDEPDRAPSHGIMRPRIPVKKIKTSRSVYQDDPKTSRPMIPVRTKSRPQVKGAPYDQNLDPDY
jgi:hypothetical protein